MSNDQMKNGNSDQFSINNKIAWIEYLRTLSVGPFTLKNSILAFHKTKSYYVANLAFSLVVTQFCFDNIPLST